MGECVFCDILSGELPGTFVYRDALCAAFMDVRPLTAGHVLVVPVQHAASFPDMPPETAAHMMVVAHSIDGALRKSGLRCEGVYMIMADGVSAGQEIPHVHLHVFPAFRNDGFGLKMPPGFGRLPQRDELEDAARLIRIALEPSA